MTYAHLETEETRRFREDFSIEELKGWYQKLLDAYHKWIAYSLNWKKKRNSIHEGSAVSVSIQRRAAGYR